MANDDNRIIAFDSNVLTYFLSGNRGHYDWGNNAGLTDQHIAAVRIFLYCRPFIPPTVKAEALRIPDTVRAAEHLSFIDGNFAEIVPYDWDLDRIQQRALELQPDHVQRDIDDCRIVAEVEYWDIPVLVTNDRGLQSLSSHTRVRLEKPSEYWASLAIPRGTPPEWMPGQGHPLRNESWWRWGKGDRDKTGTIANRQARMPTQSARFLR
jgi:hypothetical protein